MKQRMVNTDIWWDKYFSELNDQEKLLWLNLLTNPRSKICGIFEINLRHVASDLRWSIDLIKTILDKFGNDEKAYFIDTDEINGWIVLVNFLRHQKLNTNQQKGVINELKALPKNVMMFVTYCKPFSKAINELDWFPNVSEGLLVIKNESKPFETLPNPSEPLENTPDNSNSNSNLNSNFNNSSSNKCCSADEETFAAAAPADFLVLAKKYQFLNNIVKDFNLDKNVLYSLCNKHGVRKCYLAYDLVLQREADNPAGMFVKAMAWELKSNEMQNSILKKMKL